MPRHLEPDVSPVGDDPLEAPLPGCIQQDRCEAEVVFHDQQHPVARADIGAIVGDAVLHGGEIERGTLGQRRRSTRRTRLVRTARIQAPFNHQVAIERLGEVQDERAAASDLARDPNLAAEQLGNFAADREPQARPPVLAAGGAVGLLERLEDDAVLLGGDADPAVGDAERDHVGGTAQRLMIGAPAVGGDINRQVDRAPIGEFQRIRQKIFQHLLQPLGIGVDGPRQRIAEVHVEVQALVDRERLERALHVVLQFGERHRPDVHGHRPRLDLREVQDLADQIEQVRAGREDGLREFNLLVGEVVLRVLREQLRQNQEAVERRPELVRHVRQELRLVLRGQGQLFGLLLERGAGPVDFAVFVLDFPVLPGHQFGLFFQLLVGLLQLLLLLLQALFGQLQRARLLLQLRVRLGQLALARLQLARERLRLLQQVFSPHGGHDRVEHNADALGELIEKHQVVWAEPVERRQLDDRLHLAFEHHRQHHDVGRGRLAKTGADLHVIGRHVREDDALLLEGALADEPFAGAEAVGQVLALGVGVAGEQHQVRRSVLGLVEIENPVLHRDERRQLGQDRARDGLEIALALEETRELREVGLEPVLLRVLLRGVLEIADHLVDVVLEGRHLPGRVDRDGS